MNLFIFLEFTATKGLTSRFALKINKIESEK